MPHNSPIPERKSQSKQGIGFQSLVQAEKLMQIAFVLPSAMVIGWLAGAWADSKLHQSWLTIAGIIFGCVSGLVYVVRLALDAEKGVGPLQDSGKKGNGSGGAQ
jgi:F0F1-type ATP synthase assembly protein I